MNKELELKKLQKNLLIKVIPVTLLCVVMALMATFWAALNTSITFPYTVFILIPVCVIYIIYNCYKYFEQKKSVEI